MKKIISFVLVLILSFALVAMNGCGNNDQTVDIYNFLTREEAIEQYGNEYRIVKEPITLKLFVPRGSMNPEYQTMKSFKKLSELTNINFEFEHADTSAYTSLRTLAWSDEKNLPDFFLFCNSITEQVINSELEVILPFNDPDLEVNGLHVGSLIDNYMPTYKKLLESNFGIQNSSEQAKDLVTLSNGLMYATVSANNVPRDLTYKMWMNQKWIDNINTNTILKNQLKQYFGVDSLPNAVDIKTIDDFILVLRAFKKLDANMNGDNNDEIPVTAASMEYLRNFIMESYGVVTNSIEMKNKKDGYQYTPVTEAYRLYLETAKKMYTSEENGGYGVIDKEVYSILSSSGMAGKGNEGRLGCFCGAAAYLVVGYDLDDDYVIFGPLTSDYYNENSDNWIGPIHYGFSYFSPSVAEIPYTTKYVREIARLIDILYTPMGVQLFSYGEEGVDWVWDDEEHTTWTFVVPDTWKGSQEEYRATISPGVGTGASVYWEYDFIGRMNDTIIRKLNTLSERYIPYLKVDVPKDLIFTAEEYTELDLVTTQLYEYIKMAESEFIAGKWSTDKDSKDYKNFLADLETNEYKKLLAVYENAFNRSK